MIDELKGNIGQMKRIVQEMKGLESHLGSASDAEKRMLVPSLQAYKKQLGMLNTAIPKLLNEVSPIKKLKEDGKRPKGVVGVSYTSKHSGKNFVTVSKEDKEKFAKELRITEMSLSRLKKKEEKAVVRKPSELARISNLMFAKFSGKISRSFKGVARDLRRANIRFLISTYVSIALFVSLLVFVVGLVGVGVMVAFDFSLIIWAWIPLALLFVSLIGFYVYPSLEVQGVNSRISNELPFAVIYMSAIAGSNVEPTRIFRIIAGSDEYRAVGVEMKKVLALVEVYGCDLVTALKDASKKTGNNRLKELFSGLATNIVSGGSLESYLGKKAENLLIDYKLERQKYSKLAETFMDIYISILITAPLILVMMLIIMQSVDLGIGMPFSMVLILAIGGVALANVIFLIFLQLKQPKV